MNILEVEDIIKGLPDQALQKEAQAPTGNVPQFLVVSEIQRRTDMRKRFQSQQQEQPQGTISQQIVQEGIASLAPQPPQGMPPQGMPQGMPSQGMPPQGMPPQGIPPQGMPMGQSLAQPMFRGGVVEMQSGRQATIGPFPEEEEDENPYPGVLLGGRNPMSIRQFDQDWEGETGTYTTPKGGKFVEYESPEYSFRAADRLLRNYGGTHGINTIRDVINRYAPPSDDNPTESYVDFISKRSGIDPDAEIDLSDPFTRSNILSPMAQFESQTTISPEGIRDSIASVDQNYAALMPERRIDPRVPNIDTSIDIPGQTFEQPRQPVATGDFNVSEEIVGAEPYIPPMYSENRFGGAENMDALLSAIMDGKSFPKRESGERRGSVARLPVKDRQAGDFTKAIAGAIEADAEKTKGSDITEESAELVEGFTAGATGLPVVVAKEKKKSEDLFAGARRAEDLLASMSGPERAAELVESVERSGSTPRTPIDVGGLMDLIQPKEGSLDVRTADLSPAATEDAYLDQGESNKDEITMRDILLAKGPLSPDYDPNDPASSYNALTKWIESKKGRNIFGSAEDQERMDTAPESWRDQVDRYKGLFTDAPERNQEDLFAGARRAEEILDKARPKPKAQVQLDTNEPTEPRTGLKESPSTTTTTTDPAPTDTATTTDREILKTGSRDQGVAALMSDYGRTRDEAKREAFANAMIQLGAGVAAGNLAGGLSAAGKAASETMKDFRKEQQDERRLDIMKERYDQYSSGGMNQLMLRVQARVNQAIESSEYLDREMNPNGLSQAEYLEAIRENMMNQYAPGFEADLSGIDVKRGMRIGGDQVSKGQLQDENTVSRGSNIRTVREVTASG